MSKKPKQPTLARRVAEIEAPGAALARLYHDIVTVFGDIRRLEHFRRCVRELLPKHPSFAADLERQLSGEIPGGQVGENTRGGVSAEGKGGQ